MTTYHFEILVNVSVVAETEEYATQIAQDAVLASRNGAEVSISETELVSTEESR